MNEHTLTQAVIGALIGVLMTYLAGAAVAWNLNPGEWGTCWRLWCVTWAVIWAIVGAVGGFLVAENRG